MTGTSNSHVPVTVIVLTHNEEQNITACLESVTGWVGEIYVVDSYSTDSTVEIAKRYTEKIIIHPFENYSRQRNWSLDNLPLTYDWVFHIDADERVSPQLRSAIYKMFARDDLADIHGALMPRRTVFMGRSILHGGHYPVFHARLFRRKSGRCEERLYDQHFVVAGHLVNLHGDLIDIIASDLTTWTQRHAIWGKLEAQEEFDCSMLNTDGVIVGRLTGTPIEQRRWLRNSVYHRAPLFIRAFFYFFYRYFLLLGFLDGVEGLIFHFLQGCWFRFYVDSKIWELRRRQSIFSRPDPTETHP